MNWKSAYRRVLITVLLLGMALLLVPGVEASEYADEGQIFEFMTLEMGLNPAAACGIMANMEAESGFKLVCYGDEGSSFGLCQWHATRFDALKTFCKSRGYDYRTLEGQLNFLLFDLRVNYPDTYKYLRRLPNDSQGAYDAAYYWCVQYERPAGMQAAGAYRGRLAQTKYWNRFGSYVPGTGGTVVRSNGMSGLGTSSSVWDALFYWEREETSEEEEKLKMEKTEPAPGSSDAAQAEPTVVEEAAEQTEPSVEDEAVDTTEHQERCQNLLPQHPPAIPVVDGEPLLSEAVVTCNCGEIELQFSSQAPVIIYEIS